MKSTYNFLLLISLSLSISCGNTGNAQEKETKTVKIASYNVRNAKGIDNVTDFDRVAKVITEMDAHAVAIQELDSATERSKNLVVLDELAQRTNMHASFNGSIEYRGGKYGNGILTKEKPITAIGVPLPGTEEKRSLLIVELQDFVLCCTHLSLTEEDRQASIELIKEYTAKYDSKLVFLAGDLNAKPQSKEIKELSQSWTLLSDNTQPTFPSNKPDRVIDYIFLKRNNQFEYTVIENKVVDEPIASDHRPLWVKIEFERL